MAKTIKELANEAFPTNGSQTNLDRFWGYITGANAVLEEVVKFMEESSDVNVTSFKAIYDRIEELMG